jgi:hypothetical protein
MIIILTIMIIIIIIIMIIRILIHRRTRASVLISEFTDTDVLARQY